MSVSHKRISEIKDIARQVDEDSLRYHLSNNVLAVGEFLSSRTKKMNKDRQSELRAKVSQEIIKPIGEQDGLSVSQWQKEMRELEKGVTVSLHVSYLRGSKLLDDQDLKEVDKVARIVVFNDDDAGVVRFNITIPEVLVNQHMDENGSYTESANVLRFFEAHELGHLLLHLDAILEKKNGATYEDGRYDEKMEHEADLFARELLELRNKRYIDDCKCGRHTNFKTTRPR